MFDFAITAERDERLEPEAASRKATLLRFRPIMMTTMLGSRTGSEIRQPLGYAMIGGLLVSQALKLLTTPVVYLSAFAGWSRSSNPNHDVSDADGSVKQAAE